EAGAIVYAIDPDPLCQQALEATHRFFPTVPLPSMSTVSILDPEFVKAEQHGFDIVHSWGVLHHTGDMASGFRNTAQLVKPRGFLIVSIYPRHWTSPIWRMIKAIFNHLPNLLQEVMIGLLYPFFY